MTQITRDHAEWAMVGRLRLLLEEQPHAKYNVTQAYALFTMILCWVMQRIRIPTAEINSADDQVAHKLLQALSKEKITDAPWRIYAAPAKRITMIGPYRVTVPAPENFEEHTIARFLINLRDATAHGDARSVSPFNSEQLLAGFTFSCAEYKDPKDRKKRTWQGQITLLEDDLRRIGIVLAKRYCDALRRSEPNRHDGHFGSDAASIEERAA
jgi:hypothetical protein